MAAGVYSWRNNTDKASSVTPRMTSVGSPCSCILNAFVICTPIPFSKTLKDSAEAVKRFKLD